MRRVIVALAVLLAPATAWATDVLVRVSGVVGAAGVVRVAVCLPPEYAAKHCAHAARGAARPGEVAVLVPGVPPGRYAVIAHHDRAGDGVVHTNWLGIPQDGVGVSGTASGRFGPPGFDQAALDIAGGQVEVAIALRQEPGR